MIPTKLIISGFLSYRGPVEIDFSSLNLACIAGPNGAGKSSILDAITWVLFGQARKRDESLINTRSETAEVSLTFRYEGNTYRVIRENTRGKPVNLEFQIASNLDKEKMYSEDGGRQGNWKTLTERTLRATQSRIEEMLRLDYETFINASFFLQGKADQFTQQRPGDRKRILASILGLDVWETYRKRAVENRKSLETEILSLDGRLAEINNELAEEKTRQKRLAELQADLQTVSKIRSAQEKTLEDIKKITATLIEQRKLVDTLSQRLNNAEKREDELSSRLIARQTEKESHQQVLRNEAEISARYQSWIKHRQELFKWDDIAEQFRESEKRRQEPRMAIEYERAMLTQELTDLKKQETELGDLLKSIPNLQEAIKGYETEIIQIQSEIGKRRLMENELITAQENFANARAENPRLRSEMEELKSRIEQLKSVEGTACPVCGQPLSQEERNSLVDNLTVIGKTLGDKYRANQDIVDQADKKVISLKKQIKSLAPLDDVLLVRKDQVNKINTQLDHLQTKYSAWENEGVPRLFEVDRTIQEENFAIDARKALAQIDADLKEIGYDAAEHDSIRRLEKQMRVADEEYRTLELARATVVPLEDEIENIKAQIQTMQAEINEQRVEYNQAAVSLASAEAQVPDLRSAQRDLLDIQEKENQLRLEVGAARQKVMVLEDLKTRGKKFTRERETLAKKVGKYQHLERAFGKDGVPALLIESALPQIESKANEILDRLSAGSMSVRFLTQREYKDKKRQDMMETLDIQIGDSAGVRDYEMFSGGEAFRVNFAIRLALSEILAQRAGARLQTLVIDEGFGSQDEIGRQRLIEAINTVIADFEKILVITHIDSLKEAFQSRIDVTKTALGSVINVV